MVDKELSIKESFKAAAHSRVFVVLWVIILLQAISIAITVLVVGRIGEPGTPVRFDGFSSTGIFLDNGLYLIIFAFWAFIVAILNIAISLKIFGYKGRQTALAVLWLTIVLFVIAIFFIAALLSTGNAY